MNKLWCKKFECELKAQLVEMFILFAPCIIFSCDRWIVSISSPCLFLCTSFHILWAWARYFFVILVEIGPAIAFKTLWIHTTTTRWHKKPKAWTHLLEATTSLLDSNTPTILRPNFSGMPFEHALSTYYARLEWCDTDGFAACPCQSFSAARVTLALVSLPHPHYGHHVINSWTRIWPSQRCERGSHWHGPKEMIETMDI